MKRARVVTLNAALGPLDYRVPDGMTVEPGSVVIAPLGPRQLLGVAWEAERLPTDEVPDSRLRPLAGVVAVPPLAAPLRRLCEWTADYYLAPLASVLRMVLSQGLRLTLIGVVIGLAAAFGMNRVLASLLFGVKPSDPTTIAVVVMLIGAVALVACYLPARFATRVDPMIVLREE